MQMSDQVNPVSLWQDCLTTEDRSRRVPGARHCLCTTLAVIAKLSHLVTCSPARPGQWEGTACQGNWLKAYVCRIATLQRDALLTSYCCCHSFQNAWSAVLRKLIHSNQR
jgi:hypothetical protein